MPYYHVRIAKKSGEHWAFVFNLSKKQVIEEIIRPFAQWQPFMCGESPIVPSDVDYIKINETEKSASEILQKTKLKRIFSKVSSRFSETDWEGYTDEWYVAHTGKEVTRELIKGINLSEKVSRSFIMKRDVFLVHGKDYEPMKELEIMLKEFDLNPIVLEELPGGSMTIIEKLEKYSEDVGFAFAILTPDDVGFRRSRFQSLLRTATFEFDHKKYFLEETIMHEVKPRTRQNVLLEFGYFIGKLSRNRVCCLYKGNVELPSDMSGIVYICFQESVNEVRDKIVKELKAAGYEIKI